MGPVLCNRLFYSDNFGAKEMKQPVSVSFGCNREQEGEYLGQMFQIVDLKRTSTGFSAKIQLLRPKQSQEV